MTTKDYEYAAYRINEVLNREDIENNDGIMSFYDMLEYGKRGLKDLIDVTSRKSRLARALDNSCFNVFTKHYTFAYTDKPFPNGDFNSTIDICTEIDGGMATLTKYKNSESINYSPQSENITTLISLHFDTIMKSFSTLEKYSKLFGTIRGSEYCYIQVYDSLFFVRLYYNDYGQIQTEIRLSHKYDIEQKFNNKKTLKEILEKNKEQLLKKCQLN